MKKTINVARQGDVTMVRCDAHPTGWARAPRWPTPLPPIKDHLLAEGDSSGHSHHIRGRMLEQGGEIYIRLEEATPLRIEPAPEEIRHGRITLDAGDHVVRTQVEYTPEGERDVAD